MDADGVAAVLRAAETSRYYPALVLIAATGLRKGEALALSWDPGIVNLDEGWLKVRKTVGRVGAELVFSEPKTDRSRRTVPLSPAVVGDAAPAPTDQKAERLRAGDQWQETGLVFTTEFGTPVDPRNFLRVIEDGGEGCGCRRCRRPHPAALCGGGLAGGGRAYQGGRGHARALVHLDHRRHLRAHVGWHGAGCGRRVERGARTVSSRCATRCATYPRRVSDSDRFTRLKRL